MFAFIFDSVGAGEWFVLLAVLLVVMGPKRLPSTLRKFGAYYAKFRRAAENFKRQLMDMDLEMEREVRSAVNDPGVFTEPTATVEPTEPTAANVDKATDGDKSDKES